MAAASVYNNYGPTAAYNWSRLTAHHAAHLKSEWPTSADYMAASLQQHSDLSHHYAAAHYNMTGKRAMCHVPYQFRLYSTSMTLTLVLKCHKIETRMARRQIRSSPSSPLLFGRSTLNISAMSRMGEK